MLHERPASCRVRAALRPAIPAPMIAIWGIVLLLSRSLEMHEHEILLLYHTDRGFDTQAPGLLPFYQYAWLIRFLVAERCDSMKSMYIERRIHRARGCCAATYHLAKLLRHHRLLCRGADGIDVCGDHLDRRDPGAKGE